MSWLSKALGNDRVNERLNADRQRVGSALDQEASGDGWKNAFHDTAQAFLDQQMPSFLKTLGMTREDGIRRGISTGDLGTSTEGDLVSAFQKNLADSLGSLASQNYNAGRDRYLGLLGSQYDADQSGANSHNQMLGGLLGMTGGTLLSHYFPSFPGA